MFVKIDVEGAEYQVLKGGEATLNRDPRPIWILEICLREFHPSGLNPNFRKTFELFWENGYGAYTATNPNMLVTPEEISARLQNKSNGIQSFNYLFLDAKKAAKYPLSSC